MRNFLVALSTLSAAGLFLQCTSIADVRYDDSIQVPTNCDPSADPGSDTPEVAAGAAACVDNSFAVFVDATNGDDTFVGTKETPVASLGKALSILGNMTRIYICGSDTFKESISLSSGDRAASLYGGYDCGTWQYNSAVIPTVATTTSPALRVTGNGTSPLTLTVSDVSVVSGDAAVDSGASSNAIFIANADVTLRRVKATAGKGANGNLGASYSSNYYTADLDSNPANGNTGGTEKRCACKDNATSSTGGQGGNGAGAGGNPPAEDGSKGSTVPTATDPEGVKDGVGGPGFIDGGHKCQQGNDGADANNGGDGGRGALSYGTLGTTSWTPTSGSDGTFGSPGQGGGGGGGTIGVGGNTGGGGGSGACGGCGGSKGLGGTGGGASIAIALYKSTLTLDTCTLQTGSAGKGGDGSIGQDGAAGGQGSNTDKGGGCAGGNGGNGSGGGGGGGGAGGISVGILYSADSTLNEDGATHITPGAAGDPGGGGGNGTPSGASDASTGHPGLSQATLQL